LTTSSKHNFDLCKSRGAEAVFDYTDPSCGEQICEHTKGKLKLVFDTVGSDDGVRICMSAISQDTDNGGDKKYGTILFNGMPRKDMKHSFSMVLSFSGEACDKFGKHFPAIKENFEFAKSFASLTEKLAAEGLLQPHPVKLIHRGLPGMVDEGVRLGREGKVSGFKVVARVAETC